MKGSGSRRTKGPRNPTSMPVRHDPFRMLRCENSSVPARCLSLGSDELSRRELRTLVPSPRGFRYSALRTFEQQFDQVWDRMRSFVFSYFLKKYVLFRQFPPVLAIQSWNINLRHNTSKVRGNFRLICAMEKFSSKFPKGMQKDL